MTEKENTMEITPLRLAVGSHEAGSGKGCAMNVVSWESGDKTISDMPACADPLLAKVVQRVNDTYCDHRDGDFLCPPCSIEVLALAHRTVGTALNWSAADRASLYAKLAREDADSVAHLKNAAAYANAASAYAAANAANAAAAYANAASANAYYANAAAAHAKAAADDASAYAHAASAYAAADDASAYASYAASADDVANAASAYASYAADNAYAAADDVANANGVGGSIRTFRMQYAHSLIDRFEKHTGIKAEPVDEQVTARAVKQMCEVKP